MACQRDDHLQVQRTAVISSLVPNLDNESSVHVTAFIRHAYSKPLIEPSSMLHLIAYLLFYTVLYHEHGAGEPADSSAKFGNTSSEAGTEAEAAAPTTSAQPVNGDGNTEPEASQAGSSASAQGEHPASEAASSSHSHDNGAGSSNGGQTAAPADGNASGASAGQADGMTAKPAVSTSSTQAGAAAEPLPAAGSTARDDALRAHRAKHPLKYKQKSMFLLQTIVLVYSLLKCQPLAAFPKMRPSHQDLLSLHSALSFAVLLGIACMTAVPSNKSMLPTAVLPSPVLNVKGGTYAHSLLMSHLAA